MIVRKILIILRDIYELNHHDNRYDDGKVTYVNWWKNELKKQWFTEFIDSVVTGVNRPIRFYSIFGNEYILNEKFSGIKIFYSGENLSPRREHARLKKRYEKTIPLEFRADRYNNYLNKHKMDLALVFDADGLENGIRFPYWLITHFSGCYSLSDVQNRLMELEKNYHNVDYSRKNAAVIASHDFFGTRAYICDALEGTVKIDYAGKWRNNTDRLWNECENNKKRFLLHYRFNICPENMDAKEYVTEKIWDSIEAGCIPIYSGALEKPEPNIFNKDFFILWSFDNDNKEKIHEIQRISNDEEYYFMKMNKRVFVDGADEYIYSLIRNFQNGISGLLYSNALLATGKEKK